MIRFLFSKKLFESLGLQEVMNSMVGIIEKRDIFRGHGKRVNFWLEMVMEPSF